MAQQAHPPQWKQTPPGQEPTIGALAHDLTEQIPQLVRSEIRLAQAELAQKGRRVGIGLGMFSAAGLLAYFGLATLIATAVLALAEALPGWAAALIVAVVLFVAAGVAGLVGKGKVADAQPLKPERAVAGVQEDVETVKAHVKGGGR
jgi:uncharacterized membrane protein YqjE